jgi:tagatose 1,6-diphosphate aldolase
MELGVLPSGAGECRPAGGQDGDNRPAGLLADACHWIAAMEADAVAHGRPLSPTELSSAVRAGVLEPSRVRVLVVPSLPQPGDLAIGAMAHGLGIVTPATIGLSARYGVYLRSGCQDEHRVLVHELVHTAQYERLGGIGAFLQQFILEVQGAGLTGSALEREAVNLCLRICGTRPSSSPRAGVATCTDGGHWGPAALSAVQATSAARVRFEDPGRLVDEDLELVLVRCRPTDVNLGSVPNYTFEMRHAVSSVVLGRLVLRVGDADTVLRYPGHVGYDVSPEHRGHHYAARSLALIRPFATHLGLVPLWICCAPDNLASRRTCELVGAELAEVVAVPPDHPAHGQGLPTACRYRLGGSPRSPSAVLG